MDTSGGTVVVAANVASPYHNAVAEEFDYM